MTKCKFAFSELHALGHKVSGLQLTISDNHLAAVRDLPTPHDVASLRSALGFASWHASKISNFQIIAKDLHTLLRKDVPWQWTEARHNAWNKIKQLLMQAPVVALPREDLPYRLYLDASFDGLGGCVSRRGPNRPPAHDIDRLVL
jgi:RNase H-like domain found in reverse transcriptase